MESHNRDLAVQWFEEIWNRRNDSAIDELMAADAVGHMEGADVVGPAGFRASRDALLAAIPDVHIEIEDVVAEGDRAVVRWRVRGTHQGEGLGIAPTQAKIDRRGMSWFLIREGKMAEGWDSWNLGGLLESLRTHQAAMA